MRLLNIHTLRIEIFARQLPAYAIPEVTLDDMKSLRGKEALLSAMSRERKWRKKLREILNSADFPRTRGFHYIRIDTCCIVKSNSPEVSETINSHVRIV